MLSHAKAGSEFAMASKTHPGAFSVAFAAAVNQFSGLIERSVGDRRLVRFSVVGKRDFLTEISMPGRRPATAFRDVFESSRSLCNVKRVLGLELEIGRASCRERV